MPARALAAAVVALICGLCLLVLHWPSLLCSLAQRVSATGAQWMDKEEEEAVFWQFLAVTHPGNAAKAAVVQRTWGSAVQPPLWWYSDNLTNLLHVVVVRDPTYSAALARGEGYKFMTFKMQVRQTEGG